MRKYFLSIAVVLLLLITGSSLYLTYQLKGHIEEMYLLLQNSGISSGIVPASQTKEELYFLKIQDEYLAVCHPDFDTLYEKTKIPAKALPDNLRKELQSTGKTLYSAEELYGFLESYSS